MEIILEIIKTIIYVIEIIFTTGAEIFKILTTNIPVVFLIIVSLIVSALKKLLK